MREVLKISKVVFLNQLKSVWRRYGPGKLYKSLGFILAVIILVLIIFYGVIILISIHITYSLSELFNPSLPEDWLHNFILDIVSALIFLYFLYAYFMRENLLSIPPDFEFLLYQPLHARDIYAGKSLGTSAFSLFLLLYVVILYLSPIAIVFGVPWIVPLSIYLFVHAELILDPLFSISSHVLRKLGRLSMVSVLSQAYLVFGVVHSLFISYSLGLPSISPFLSYPVKGLYLVILKLYELVGYLSFFIYFIVAFFICLLVTSSLGRIIEVTDFVSFRDIYELRLSRKLRKVLRRESLVSWVSPAEALRRVVLEFTVYNPRLLLRNYTPIFMLVLIVGFTVRSFLHGLDLTVQSYLISFIVVAGIMVYEGFIMELLANDLKHLWVYRVYLIDLSPLSKILIVKYAIASLLTMFILTGLIASLSANFMVFAAPLIVLPVCIFSIFITLLIAATLLKRAKHHEPASEIYMRGGLPLIDPISQLLFWPLVLSAVITYLSLAICSFMTISSQVSHLYVVVALAVSLVASYVEYIIFSRILARVYAKCDVNV